MSGWIIAAALGSIAVTALLTFVLWRMNAPPRERARDDSGAGYVAPIVVTGGANDRDMSDGTTDGASDAGSDGGGGGGGGGE